jgi:hypothetical protein
MHLSKEQVAELVAPHPETLELVNSWVEYHGVLFLRLNDTRRRLADIHWCARILSKWAPWRIIPDLPTR